MSRPGYIQPIRLGAGVRARSFGVPRGGVNRGRVAILKVSDLRALAWDGRAIKRGSEGRRLRSVGSGDEDVGRRRWR
jgi:hypothetical protein